MSAPIEDLRRVARISRREHLAIFDHYIALGRDIETLAIKFGYNPPDIITILEGYGDTVCEESRGRLRELPQSLVKEYVEHFYPGIASENPENDWICIEAYLDAYHAGWRNLVGEKRAAKKKKWRGLY